MPRKKPDPDYSKSSLVGVRFLLGDIALLQGDHQAAMKEYLAGAPNSLTGALVPGGADCVPGGGLCGGLHLPASIDSHSSFQRTSSQLRL